MNCRDQAAAVANRAGAQSRVHTDDAPHRVDRYFQTLGLAIADQLGETAEEVQRDLATVAVAALEQHNPSSAISHGDLIDYVLGCDTLCEQADLAAEFGEPPLTLFRSRHFSISVLTWLDGTTSIHQHEFAGAFHVLQGSSIHSLYRFHADGVHPCYPLAMAGRLELIDIEVLGAGDTRPIDRGADFIHSLFHMTRPSLTVVVRTTGSYAQAQPQYDYRWPGLALDPFQKHGPTTRKLQYLRTLKTLDAVAYPALLERVLDRADLFLAYTLVSETLVADTDVAQAQRLAQRCAALSPAERELLYRAAHYDMTSRTIIACRRKLHHPDHRLLLALLLNVYDRERLLSLVQRETGCGDAITQVCNWVAEISGNTDRYPNLIGIDFNTTALQMLSAMLAGCGPQAALQQFSEGYGQEAVATQRESLLNLYAALKDCALFSILFADLPTN